MCSLLCFAWRAIFFIYFVAYTNSVRHLINGDDDGDGSTEQQQNARARELRDFAPLCVRFWFDGFSSICCIHIIFSSCERHSRCVSPSAILFIAWEIYVTHCNFSSWLPGSDRIEISGRGHTYWQYTMHSCINAFFIAFHAIFTGNIATARAFTQCVYEPRSYYMRIFSCCALFEPNWN